MNGPNLPDQSSRRKWVSCPISLTFSQGALDVDTVYAWCEDTGGVMSAGHLLPLEEVHQLAKVSGELERPSVDS